MPRILEALKLEGAHALHKSVWVVAGAALGAGAAVFAAAALVSGLSTIMPLYGALACGALFLITLSVICFVAARAAPAAKHHHTEAVASAANLPELAFHLLESEVRAQPGKTATTAVIAGLILGALDALERNEKLHAESS